MHSSGAINEALEAAELGDFDAARALRREAPAADSFRLRGAMWLAGLEPAPPTLAELQSIARESPRNGVVLASRYLQRAAVLAFDRDQLERVQRFSGELVREDDRVGHLWHSAGQLWLAVADGRADASWVDSARSLEAEAASARDASLVLELASLRALLLLTIGDLHEATDAARRASRMARTEGRPQCEYLANIVLARVRRLVDHPHLALRILGALRRVAPPPWARWLDWELRMAGEHPTEATGPHAGIDRVLDAARAGARPLFDAASRELLSDTRSFAPARRDAEGLVYCLDPSATIVADEEAWRSDAQAWRRGDEPMPPGGLQALGLAEDSPEEDAVAYVIAPADSNAVRVLRSGMPLATGLEQLLRLQQSARKRGRIETAASALLLAGDDGVEEKLLFRLVYGFDFQEGVHEGVLDVVLHRLRAQIGEHGEVARRGDRIKLTHRGMLVPDPRCSQPLDDRVLAQLARRGRASAQDTAKALDLPLRTIQHALKRLSSEGACTKERVGRNVEYRLEDTTFSEPTRH